MQKKFEDVVVLQYLAAPVDAVEAGLIILIIDRQLHVHTQSWGWGKRERRATGVCEGESSGPGGTAAPPPTIQFGWGDGTGLPTAVVEGPVPWVPWSAWVRRCLPTAAKVETTGRPGDTYNNLNRITGTRGSGSRGAHRHRGHTRVRSWRTRLSFISHSRQAPFVLSARLVGPAVLLHRKFGREERERPKHPANGRTLPSTSRRHLASGTATAMYRKYSPACLSCLQVWTPRRTKDAITTSPGPGRGRSMQGLDGSTKLIEVIVSLKTKHSSSQTFPGAANLTTSHPHIKYNIPAFYPFETLIMCTKLVFTSQQNAASLGLSQSCAGDCV